jgi:hypothetical protein
MPGGNENTSCFSLARQVLLSWCAARSGGGQDPQSSCPGNRLRPAVDAEFAGKLKLTYVAIAPTLERVLPPECGYAH